MRTRHVVRPRHAPPTRPTDHCRAVGTPRSPPPRSHKPSPDAPQPTVRDHPAAHPRHVVRSRHTPADAPDGPLPSGRNSPLTSAEVAQTVGRRLRNRQFVTTRRPTRGMSCDLDTHRRAVTTPRSLPPRSHEPSPDAPATDSSRPLGDPPAACRATSAGAPDAPDGPLPSGRNSPLTSAEVARTVARRPRNRQFAATRRPTRGMSCDLGGRHEQPMARVRRREPRPW